MSKKFAIPLMILFLISLYVILNKVVIPFVMNVAESDLFFEKIDESEELGKVDNEHSRMALQQCERYLKDDGALPQSAVVDSPTYEAWALGNKTFLVKAAADDPGAEADKSRRTINCQIKLTGTEESSADSWKVLGSSVN